MKVTAKEFASGSNKAVTLLGMSGVGKTHISNILPSSQWFHYSGDYRIGTKYLDEPILDCVKKEAMRQPYLREILCKDYIYIRNNITIDHLQPISHFLGKLGDAQKGGLCLKEFKWRQALFRDAELRAMQDVGAFMRKARDIYGYPHFINDAGGSVCALSDSECWEELSRNTVILYLQADQEMENTLIERARRSPKPLFYESDFLDRHVNTYLQEFAVGDVNAIDPDHFVQWVFPMLIAHRRPRYAGIAEKYGYTIDAKQIFDIDCTDALISLICDAIACRE